MRTTKNIANLDIGTYLIPISPQTHSTPPPREPPEVHTKLDWPRNKPNHSNRWLVSALALVLLLLLGLIIYCHQNTAPASVLVTPSCAPNHDAQSPCDRSCVPSKEIPPIHTHLLRDDNSTILAEAAGYVQLLDSELGLGYLPLNFHSIYRERLFNGPMLVSLVGDCTTLEIAYKMCESNLNYDYKNFELHIKRANGLRPQKRCDFERTNTMQKQPIELRYSCQQTRSRMCSRARYDQQGQFKTQQQVAQLVLSSFQLELNGDPLALQRGEFSKAAWPNSCNILSVA